MGQSYRNNQIIINSCHLNESEFFHSYLLAYRYHLASVIPYHVLEYPIYLWVDILTTFSWNFIDVFIILVSVALDTRFKQINHRILTTRNRSLSFNVNTQIWNDIRIHYYGLMELVEKVDDEISILILLSTGHNLFNLCVIIFRCLTRYVYLWLCNYEIHYLKPSLRLNRKHAYFFSLFRLIFIILSTGLSVQRFSIKYHFGIHPYSFSFELRAYWCVQRALMNRQNNQKISFERHRRENGD